MSGSRLPVACPSMGATKSQIIIIIIIMRRAAGNDLCCILMLSKLKIYIAWCLYSSAYNAISTYQPTNQPTKPSCLNRLLLNSDYCHHYYYYGGWLLLLLHLPLSQLAAMQTIATLHGHAIELSLNFAASAHKTSTQTNQRQK